MIEKRKAISEVEKILRHLDETQFSSSAERKGKIAEKYSTKHKADSELKREVRKLKSYQNQIASWLNDADVKDKNLNKTLKKTLESLEGRFKELESNEAFAYLLESLVEEHSLKKKPYESHHQWISDMLNCFEKAAQNEETLLEKNKLQQKKAKSLDESSKESTVNSDTIRYKWHITRLRKLEKILDQETVDMAHLERLRDYLLVISQGDQLPDTALENMLYDALGYHGVSPSNNVEEVTSHPGKAKSGGVEEVLNTKKKMDKGNLDDPVPAATNLTLHSVDSGNNADVEEDGLIQTEQAQENTEPVSQNLDEFLDVKKEPRICSSSLQDQSDLQTHPEDQQTKTLEGRVDLPLLTSIVEQAYQYLPCNVQRQRVRHYQSRTLWPTPPPSFPSYPLRNHATPEFFQNLDLDTLFFIFYYQQVF